MTTPLHLRQRADRLVRELYFRVLRPAAGSYGAWYTTRPLRLISRRKEWGVGLWYSLGA